MAILRPDEYQHTNSNYALLDEGQLRGSARTIPNIVTLKNIPIDKRLVGMIVSVQFYDEAAEGAISGGEFKALQYISEDLTDTAFQNLSNWRPFSGSGSATAAQISYDNAVSGIAASNVQTAIDVLDATVDTHTTTLAGYGNVVSYDTGISSNNIPQLDSSGLLPVSTIPVININTVTAVATIPDRDALTPAVGDVAVVADTDLGTVGDQRASYMWSGTVWIEISNPTEDLLLSASITASTVSILSPFSTSDAIIPSATATLAGLFLPAEKLKLDGIAADAEANIKPDWDALAATDAEILNKPTDLTVLSNHVIEGLSNVVVTSLAINDVLSYNGTNWENKIVTLDLSTSTDAGANTVNVDIQGTGNSATLVAATAIAPGLMSKEDKAKLDGINTSAEANVQSDWNVVDAGSDAYIVNKPTDVTDLSSHNLSEIGDINVSGIDVNHTISWTGATWTTRLLDVNLTTSYNNITGVITINSDLGSGTTINPATDTTTGLMTKEDKLKLDGLTSGAEVNVQSDWNVTDGGADEYIANKPTDVTDLSSHNIEELSNVDITGIGSDFVLRYTGTTWDVTKLDTTITVTHNGGGTVTLATPFGTDGTINSATNLLPGLMSATDKIKLDKFTLAGNTGSILYTDTSGNLITTAAPTTSGDMLVWNGTTWVAQQVNIPGTDLTTTENPTNIIIHSSTGSDATIPLATVTNAGLISSAEKAVIGTAAAGTINQKAVSNGTTGLLFEDDNAANVALTPSTNMAPSAVTVQLGIDNLDDRLNTVETGTYATNLSQSVDAGAGTITIVSSSGDNTTLPAATISTPGLMTIEDHTLISTITTGTIGQKATSNGINGITFEDDNAANINFDTTGTNITGTTVQAALVETDGRVKVLEDAGIPTALQITYDNTASGLAGNNVQDAIDALNTKVDGDDASVTIVYVNSAASGSNDGTSWADAYTDLQTAITSAVPNSQLWVVAGTYKPTATTDTSISFDLPSNISIYGGFAGDEVSVEHRDFIKNTTILSGDIASTGTTDATNSLRVMTIVDKRNVIVDGITLTRGWCLTDGGAGFYANGASGLVFRNIIMEELKGTYWAAFLANTCSIGMENITINNCTAAYYASGTFFNSSYILKNCTISNCTATSGISGIVSRESRGIIDVLNVNNCDSGTFGGLAVYTYSKTNPNHTCVANRVNVKNCTAGFGAISTVTEDVTQLWVMNSVFEGVTLDNINHGVFDMWHAVGGNAYCINNTFLNNIGGSDITIEATSAGNTYIYNTICQGNTRSMSIEANVTGDIQIDGCKFEVALIASTPPSVSSYILGTTTFDAFYSPQEEDVLGVAVFVHYALTDDIATIFDFDNAIDFKANKRYSDETLDIGAVQSVATGGGSGGGKTIDPIAVDLTSTSYELALNSQIKTLNVLDGVTSQPFTVIGLSETKEITQKYIINCSANTVPVSTITWPTEFLWDDSWGTGGPTGLAAGASYRLIIESESATTAFAQLIPMA